MRVTYELKPEDIVKLLSYQLLPAKVLEWNVSYPDPWDVATLLTGTLKVTLSVED